MSTRMKIAPMLHWLMRNEWSTSWPDADLPEGMRDVDVWAAAEQEVKALLAVARAARTVMHHDGCGSDFGDECDCLSRDVGRALARLDRVSRGGR